VGNSDVGAGQVCDIDGTVSAGCRARLSSGMQAGRGGVEYCVERIGERGPVFRGSDVEKVSTELRTDVNDGENGRGGLRTIVDVDNEDRIEILGDYRQNFWHAVVFCVLCPVPMVASRENGEHVWDERKHIIETHFSFATPA
jgi:hypothetical protein